MSRDRARVIALVSAACLGLPAIAQEQGQPADILKGPSAGEAPARKTIVTRDGTGAFQPLDTRPEQAAIEVLGLTPQGREAADKVLAEHAAAVSKLLYDNLALFTKIQSARQSGDREAVGPLIRELAPQARPILEPPLVERVAQALPAERRDEFRALVREYAHALTKFEEENRRGMVDNGKPAPRDMGEGPGAPRRFEMNQLIREMGRTLRSVVDERKARTEELLRQFEATPEQEEKIRAIVREAGEASGGKPPSAEQRGETMRKILDVLTPEQRRKAIERLRAERGG